MKSTSKAGRCGKSSSITCSVARYASPRAKLQKLNDVKAQLQPLTSDLRVRTKPPARRRRYIRFIEQFALHSHCSPDRTAFTVGNNSEWIAGNPESARLHHRISGPRVNRGFASGRLSLVPQVTGHQSGTLGKHTRV